MAKRLVEHGDNIALVITKPMLKKLGIDRDAVFTLDIQDGNLTITFSKKKMKKSLKKKEESIKEIGERIMNRYSSVFKKLAE